MVLLLNKPLLCNLKYEFFHIYDMKESGDLDNNFNIKMSLFGGNPISMSTYEMLME